MFLMLMRAMLVQMVEYGIEAGKLDRNDTKLELGRTIYNIA
jgi:hypothetical protein